MAQEEETLDQVMENCLQSLDRAEELVRKLMETLRSLDAVLKGRSNG